MMTSRNLISGVLVCLALTACRHDAASSVSPAPSLSASGQPEMGRVPGPRTQSVRLTRKTTSPSAQEQAIIEQILERHPADARPALRPVLEDRFATLHLPPGSEEQGLLDQLAAVRAVAAEPWPDPVDATVALVDRLPDPSASAVVLRRKTTLPHDLILLPDGNATTAVLHDGIGALIRMRRDGGDIPDRDTRLVIRGAHSDHEEVWASAMERRRAVTDLADLEVSPPRGIEGIGEVRAITIPLRATARRSGNPSPAKP